MVSSIKLPDVAFRNLKDAKLLALDIGGSLAKIAYYSTVPVRRLVYDLEDTANEEDGRRRQMIGGTMYSIDEGARLHFVKFETCQIQKCLNYVSQKLSLTGSGNTIHVTGGGAFKYSDLIKSKLNLDVIKVDEMACICAGANFLLKNIADEAFIYQRDESPRYKFFGVTPPDLYPYLLVTIGSGVSVIKVNSEDSFERIGGTATGGGTFWGLGKLLTKAEGFDELLELASLGDFRQVDMLVKDIYGDRCNEYTSLGLSPNLIASTFGKAIHVDKNLPSADRPFSDADIARSLLYLVSNDVGQIATLYAMLHSIKSIYFGGFFLRRHPVSLHTISYAVNYWSKGNVQAYFLRHEGYLGAIGAFLKGAGSACQTDHYSWTENLYGSTSFFEPSSRKSEDEDDAYLEVTDHLEIDRYETQLGFCPLLADSGSYSADTVDLCSDQEAREYWLRCFEESLPKFTERAVQSQAHSESSESRAVLFTKEFLSRLYALKSQPFAHGNLTVRSLLDMREHCLSEFDFHDPYWKQKRVENDEALRLLPDRLEYLKTLEFEQRQLQLAIGLLAGNVFDWGAKEVALLMEDDVNQLDFNKALVIIKPRPWLIDNFDCWVQRLSNGPSHKCAAIFIDNSGVDVVLGIIPFAKELLNRGTNVLLCANNRPVLNDVTFSELSLILQRAAKLDSVLSQSLKSGRLACYNSGQSSPCLDLSRLDKGLIDTMVEKKVDLLVLEGMGRAIHTNLFTRFKCECLKVAVLKNRWLAARLGGDMFSVVFNYEQPICS